MHDCIIICLSFVDTMSQLGFGWYKSVDDLCLYKLSVDDLCLHKLSVDDLSLYNLSVDNLSVYQLSSVKSTVQFIHYNPICVYNLSFDDLSSNLFWERDPQNVCKQSLLYSVMHLIRKKCSGAQTKNWGSKKYFNVLSSVWNLNKTVAIDLFLSQKKERKKGSNTNTLYKILSWTIAY